MDTRYIKTNSGSVLVLGLLMVLLACRSKEAPEERKKYIVPDSLMKTLLIDTVKTGDLTYAIKFNGIVDFNTDKVSNIFPMISGNVQNINVQPGDFVRTGQVLGMIKSAEIANYNALLINTEANVRLTKKQLDQQKSFFSSGLSSQVEVTNAEVNYEQALAAKTAAEKVLSINGDNKNGEYFIKSPLNGFIVQKNVTNGMAIRTDNGMSMFTISDLKNVWVQANVYEANIGKVHEGDPVEVTTISYPDRIFKGKVNKLMNVLDPTTKVMKMRVVLDNPDYALKPQMFATISIIIRDHKQAITIASTALIYDHSQYYVVVLKGNKDVELRPVDVISINGTKAYLKSGVSSGERLIASQALLIYGSLNS
ncbi:MAG: efflux RND transporter periplasmic adaptor subunit [Candidatus Pedobacter colombiensis]|uniref:Efflux RND transporter periplasmic adaptor subunit n=1 Tax=Candidatus Pedobacter colombiensis TaxID=3121371 RepID=A0AAJ6B640_9SPHI|nr:efflux RND transporter periplasmic adaptor subunit [Pedobacter sp.]WEK18151.1 MAG: efflux RND transporter periplasmic adaptor subunit [Pedobacter sp.]